MATHIVTLLASARDDAALISQRQRCVRWIQRQNYTLGDTLLFGQNGAGNSEYLCNAIRARADELAIDLLVMESLSVLGYDRFELLSILDYLPAKKGKIVTLKESMTPDLTRLRMLAMAGAYSPIQPNRQCIFHGKRSSQAAARKLCETLGWSVSMPRNPKVPYEDRLALAHGKTLLISHIKALPGRVMSDYYQVLQQLLEMQQAFYILELGLDSLSPNIDEALRTALLIDYSPVRRPRRDPKEVRASLPPMREVLTHWAHIRLKTRPGKVAEYSAELGLSTTLFFRFLREYIAKLKAYHDAHPTFEAVAKEFGLEPHHVQFAFFWTETSGSRTTKNRS
jgi:DNA invertase Pin-like site-specific DNA recombinase